MRPASNTGEKMESLMEVLYKGYIMEIYKQIISHSFFPFATEPSLPKKRQQFPWFKSVDDMKLKSSFYGFVQATVQSTGTHTLSDSCKAAKLFESKAESKQTIVMGSLGIQFKLRDQDTLMMAAFGPKLYKKVSNRIGNLFRISATTHLKTAYKDSSNTEGYKLGEIINTYKHFVIHNPSLCLSEKDYPQDYESAAANPQHVEWMEQSFPLFFPDGPGALKQKTPKTNPMNVPVPRKPKAKEQSGEAVKQSTKKRKDPPMDTSMETKDASTTKKRKHTDSDGPLRKKPKPSSASDAMAAVDKPKEKESKSSTKKKTPEAATKKKSSAKKAERKSPAKETALAAAVEQGYSSSKKVAKEGLSKPSSKEIGSSGGKDKAAAKSTGKDKAAAKSMLPAPSKKLSRSRSASPVDPNVQLTVAKASSKMMASSWSSSPVDLSGLAATKTGAQSRSVSPVDFHKFLTPPHTPKSSRESTPKSILSKGSTQSVKNIQSTSTAKKITFEASMLDSRSPVNLKMRRSNVTMPLMFQQPVAATPEGYMLGQDGKVIFTSRALEATNRMGEALRVEIYNKFEELGTSNPSDFAHFFFKQTGIPMDEVLLTQSSFDPDPQYGSSSEQSSAIHGAEEDEDDSNYNNAGATNMDVEEEVPEKEESINGDDNDNDKEESKEDSSKSEEMDVSLFIDEEAMEDNRMEESNDSDEESNNSDEENSESENESDASIHHNQGHAKVSSQGQDDSSVEENSDEDDNSTDDKE